MNTTINKLLMLFAVFVLAGACESDYLDINTDPNNPTVAPANQILTNVEVQLTNTFSMGGSGLSSALSTYMHQTVQYRNSAFYGVTGADYVVSTSWSIFYNNILEDLRILIDKQTEEDNMVYVGIAKILKAYTYSQMVDVWGGIPYSEANKMPEIRFPKYDKDSEIYPKLFALIDEGVVNLQQDAANAFIPGKDDLFYTGNIESWITLANSIKLKMYNNIRLTSDVSTEVKALLSGSIINASSADWQLEYGTSQEPENRNPGYVNEYGGASMEFYISPWFFHILRGDAGGDLGIVNPMEGITDPRVPYYFFNQVTAGQVGDVSEIEYAVNNYISIYFGGNGQYHGAGKDKTATVPGLYPFGGRFDDGKGTNKKGVGKDFPGPATVPVRLLTYHKMLYIRAELALAGVTTEDARALLSDAMNASFAKVNQIVTKYLPKQDNVDVPTISAANVTTYVDAVLAKYDAADNDGKMQIIMTQKWIATFGNNVDQYTDYRRTGFPVLYNPNTDALPDTEVTKSFPVALPYNNDDLKINPNAPVQRTAVDGVFWDK